MIVFPDLITPRFTLKLKEISIGDAIEVVQLSDTLFEARQTAFLRAVIKDIRLNKSEYPSDPKDWTIQERIHVVAHYLMVISDGDKNFPVSEASNYLDYLTLETNINALTDYIEIGQIVGYEENSNQDIWCIRHLTGRFMESAERVKIKAFAEMPDALYWFFALLSIQMVRKEDIDNGIINSTNDQEIDDWLAKHIATIKALPEGAFSSLQLMYRSSLDKLTHFYKLGFCEYGIACLPLESNEEGEESIERPLARFPMESCISGDTWNIIRQLV